MPIAGPNSTEAVTTAAPNKRLITLISTPPPFLIPDPALGVNARSADDAIFYPLARPTKQEGGAL
jgi:hypothetical protein